MNKKSRMLLGLGAVIAVILAGFVLYLTSIPQACIDVYTPRRQLTSLAKAIAAYTILYDNEYPPDLDSLRRGEHKCWVGEFKSPVSQGGADYFYNRPPCNVWWPVDWADLILVYENPANYDGKRTGVVLLNGDVETLPIQEFQKRQARTLAAFAAATTRPATDRERR